MLYVAACAVKAKVPQHDVPGAERRKLGDPPVCLASVRLHACSLNRPECSLLASLFPSYHNAPSLTQSINHHNQQQELATMVCASPAVAVHSVISLTCSTRSNRNPSPRYVARTGQQGPASSHNFSFILFLASLRPSTTPQPMFRNR